mgnify:CR=1 FL=1
MAVFTHTNFSYLIFKHQSDSSWRIIVESDKEADLRPEYVSLFEKFQESESLSSGDFNGDGAADMLWRNRISGANHMWLIKGTPWSKLSTSPDPVVTSDTPQPNIDPDWSVVSH